MLTVSRSQIASLDALSFDRFVSRLCGAMQNDYFADGLAKRVPDINGLESVRALALNLIRVAGTYGFDCEGDVTPFCLLTICESPDFRQHSSYAWIVHIISAKEYGGEERMDAVFSLLQPKPRQMIFADSLEHA